MNKEIKLILWIGAGIIAFHVLLSLLARWTLPRRDERELERITKLTP